MTPKELFMRDRDLLAHWGPVCSSEWFARTAMHAMASVIDRNGITPEQIKGAKALLEELFDLGTPDPQSVEVPPSGLRHDIDTITVKPE